MCLTAHCPLLSRLPFCEAAHTYQKYLIPWKLSAITAMNFKSFSSNYYSSPEIMKRLLHTLKCQADHSKIQVRFLQEGPDDKTFYEPFFHLLFHYYAALTPSQCSNTFWDKPKLKQTTKAATWTKLTVCAWQVQAIHSFFFPWSDSIIWINFIFFL